MNKDKREPDLPVELETQFIMRLPEEPAKTLREVLQLGDSIKNRLSIQIENDMRHGEVRFDHWLLHAKIVDLPTIVESLKTIDRKSVYKTADISQIMICKDEPEPSLTEEEAPTKNKKKDPFKVDKKFLWPHGITPPTKNVRKRRFRKTLKKKSVEAPEIEKEVKRLLRADNEAVSITWEVINEEDDNAKPEPSTSTKSGKQSKQSKAKKEHNIKHESAAKKQPSSKVEDIFGGTLSDSDLEDENINVEVEDSHLSSYEDRISETSVHEPSDSKGGNFASQFNSDMFYFHGLGSDDIPDLPTPKALPKKQGSTSASSRGYQMDDFLQLSSEASIKLQQLSVELEELKQRKVRTQHEMVGMENAALRQRFHDILQTLNKDIKYKEAEYQSVLAKK